MVNGKYGKDKKIFRIEFSLLSEKETPQPLGYGVISIPIDWKCYVGESKKPEAIG